MAKNNYKSKERSSIKNKNQKDREKNKRFKDVGRKDATNSCDTDYAKVDKNPSSAARALGNDISWYVPSDALLADVASLPFSRRLGDPMSLSYFKRISDSPVIPTYTVPGVAAYTVYPSIGGADGDPGDPVNLAQKAIYSYVRHANSGSKNYDSPDLMKYLLAMDSLMMWWAYLVRVYGTARYYSTHNVYAPRTILRAMGVMKPEALMMRLAQFKSVIDMLAAQMSQFMVPTVFPYFERHLWLFTRIFKDADNDKAQLSFMVPGGLYMYDDTQLKLSIFDFDDRGFILLDDPIESAMVTTELLIQPLLASEDVGIMSGDILKAYGPSNVYQFNAIPADYMVVPEFNPIANDQLSNATFAGCKPTEITYNANNNLIETFTSGNGGSLPAAVLNIDSNSVSPTDIMYMTRLISLKNADADGRPVCGSEVLYNVKVYRSTHDTEDPMVWNNPMAHVVGAVDYDDVQKMMDVMEMTTTFENFPTLFAASTGSTTSEWSRIIPVTRWHNYRLMDYDTLLRMNRVAFLGMFGIPNVATKA